MFSGSLSVTEAGGFQCRCSLGFGGPLCELQMDLSTSAQFREGAYLVLPRSLMPHTSSHEFETISLIFKVRSSKFSSWNVHRSQRISGKCHFWVLYYINKRATITCNIRSNSGQIVKTHPMPENFPTCSVDDLHRLSRICWETKFFDILTKFRTKTLILFCYRRIKWMD